MYDAYKPLRNKLRQYDVISCLQAVYFFNQYLISDLPLPPKFSHASLRYKKPPDVGLYPWEFETLAREALINCGDRAPNAFSSWNDVRVVINHIRRIENDVWGEQEHRDDIILYELLRIAHRQFPWQEKLDAATVAR